EGLHVVIVRQHRHQLRGGGDRFPRAGEVRAIQLDQSLLDDLRFRRGDGFLRGKIEIHPEQSGRRLPRAISERAHGANREQEGLPATGGGGRFFLSGSLGASSTKSSMSGTEGDFGFDSTKSKFIASSCFAALDGGGGAGISGRSAANASPAGGWEGGGGGAPPLAGRSTSIAANGSSAGGGGGAARAPSNPGSGTASV